MSASHIHFFFTLRDQIKLYHWQTFSYSRHKATDGVIKELDEHIDKFVEVWSGKYGRSRLTSATNTLSVRNLGDAAMVRFVKESITYLQGSLTKSLAASDTDLANIRDEMLGNLHQLLYLFTLK
jgi:DNA-binding ferritin-like protein